MISWIYDHKNPHLTTLNIASWCSGWRILKLTVYWHTYTGFRDQCQISSNKQESGYESTLSITIQCRSSTLINSFFFFCRFCVICCFFLPLCFLKETTVPQKCEDPVWCSGPIPSNACYSFMYLGPSLCSGQRFYNSMFLSQATSVREPGPHPHHVPERSGGPVRCGAQGALAGESQVGDWHIE